MTHEGFWRRSWRLITRRRRTPLRVLASIVLLLVFILVIRIYVEAPPFLADRDASDRVVEERRNIIAIIAGALAFAGLIYTHRRHELSRDENRTNRYTQAIDQLGSTNLTIRLGGIYGLERVAKDSPDDLPTVHEVLCSFVRTRSTEVRQAVETVDQQTLEAPLPMPRSRMEIEDIRAAVTVLSRGKIARVTHSSNLAGANLSGMILPRPILRSVILANADLSGAHLFDATLTSAWLPGADLTRAVLPRSDLSGAALHEVKLTEAALYDAILTGADMTGADLMGADLKGADLKSADLSGANLTRAVLGGADLTGATLAGAELTEAFVSREQLTSVEGEWTGDPDWQE